MTMTDRELLEAAAKADGHGVEFDDVSGLTYWGDRFTGLLWNPLHNDGDALRLAVKLGICLGPNFDGTFAVAFGDDGRNITEPLGDDPCAATRRAVVRAAASLSQEKPHG